eukprot:s2630_g6.t1
MPMSPTGFTSLSSRGVLDIGAALFIGYALFSCSENAVFFDDTPCVDQRCVDACEPEANAHICETQETTRFKEKKKVVIKVVKKRGSKAKTPKTTELGGDDPEGHVANQPRCQLTPAGGDDQGAATQPTGPLTAPEAFDIYAQQSSEFDKHRLTRQEGHLKESDVDLCNLETDVKFVETPLSADEETQPAMLPDQAPAIEAQHDEAKPSTSVEDLEPTLADTQAEASPAPAQQDGERPEEKPEEKPEEQNSKAEPSDQAWNWSWGDQEPWSWERWTAYGSWGSSNWSGDYWDWKDGYSGYARHASTESFDSQRSELTSQEWLNKAWDRLDSQDLEPQKESPLKKDRHAWAECAGDWTKSKLYLSIKDSHSTKRQGKRVWLTRKQLKEKFGESAEDIIERKVGDPDLKAKEAKKGKKAAKKKEKESGKPEKKPKRKKATSGKSNKEKKAKEETAEEKELKAAKEQSKKEANEAKKAGPFQRNHQRF